MLAKIWFPVLKVTRFRKDHLFWVHLPVGAKTATKNYSKFKFTTQIQTRSNFSLPFLAPSTWRWNWDRGSFLDLITFTISFGNFMSINKVWCLTLDELIMSQFICHKFVSVICQLTIYMYRVSCQYWSTFRPKNI